MKTFLLSCINEEGRVVSMERYDTMAEAWGEMKAQMERESCDAENSGFDVSCDIDENRAWVTYGESSYCWEVKPLYNYK